ncbi:MAG: hypothetical protein H7175_10260, partial [Burkholderiales bacterium]|nr:hypothetical protein [Anaerolineae bacterium]
MRLRFLLLLLFLMPSWSSAQDDDEMWFFAWRESTGEIFAYDGLEHVNILMRAERVGWWYAARIAPDRALAQAISGGNAGFYLLSPNTAQPLLLNFEPSILSIPLTEAYSAFRRNENFVVLLPDDYHHDEPALLVDLAAARIEILTPNIFSAYQASFSEDGRTLRYMAQAISSGVVTERERNLVSGEERILRIGR